MLGLGRSLAIGIQVALIASLLAAALFSSWQASSAVVERDRQRAEAEQDLALANARMSAAGATGLALVPEWPATLDADEWDALSRWLEQEARSALAAMPSTSGGYYVVNGDRYLGSVLLDAGTPSGSPTRTPAGIRSRSQDINLIENQIHESIEKNVPLLRFVDSPPLVSAVRTSPIVIDGRCTAAVWAVRRFDESDARETTVRGYRSALAFALGSGLASLTLSVTLAWTIRRQARERRRLQEELRRSERLAALGKLLAGVAHEVRNPLAGIRSTVQLWQRGVGQVDEMSSDLIAEVERIDAIIARLLQFSKAETEKLVPGDLNSVVADAARLAKPEADARQVRVELDLASSLPEVAMSASALLQVFRNLTSNALHAMPRGGSLRLSTRKLANGGMIEASVADTGIGIADGVRAHLFEPFFTTREDGTGLGLAIAREIALAHGGELRAATRNGQPGAVFTLALPEASAE